MRKLPLALLLLCSAAFLSAQPKVAVLNTVVASNVESEAGYLVTDKLIGELVASKKYSVLSRGEIDQVLKEKQFQLSGNVADNEIREAGVFLGADLVVVARLSRVGSIYYLSAKMIDVVSGEITMQKAFDRQGEVEVVFFLADAVAKSLVGLKVDQRAAAAADKSAEQARLAQERQDRIDAQEAERRRIEAEKLARKNNRPKVKTHLTMDLVAPLLTGEAYDQLNSWIEGHDWNDYDEPIGVGLDLHLLQPLLGWIYGSLCISYVFEESTFDTGYYEYPYEIYSSTTVLGSVGLVIPLSHKMQIYGGIGAGLTSLTLGDYWYYEGDMELAPATSYEIGLDIFFLQVFVLGFRYQSVTAVLPGGTIFSGAKTFNPGSFNIGLGIAF